MTNATSGSMRLFRALGVNVYLHWTWFLFAVLRVAVWQNEKEAERAYSAPGWLVVEYVTFFAIVLLHEYGHALACRQVGGKAETIVLWPLGGIAFVAPPERPGPVLWSIAAGPLVNVALLVPTWGLVIVSAANGWADAAPDLARFVFMVALTNTVLLIFNLIPAYPLDGGQILMAMLWFHFGRWSALLAASVIGIGFAGLLLLTSLACIVASPVFGGLMAFMALFAGSRSLLAFHAARHFLRMEALPRHKDCLCPRCRQAPPAGPYWACEHCTARFDLFDARGHCPDCGAWYLEPRCPACGEASHVDRWFAVAAEGEPKRSEDEEPVL
jgi:Zn-dependent protease